MRTIFISLLCFAFSSFAELKVNELFTSNMVIQRNMTVPVFGTADAGDIITVEFAGQKKSVAAGADGKWTAELSPLPACAAPAAMKISSAQTGKTILLEDVLIGDVWLCAGQSNMASIMKNYPKLQDAIPEMKNNLVRLFKMKHEGAGAPEPVDVVTADDALKKSWQPLTPEYAAEFSATACFFGQELHELNNGVPVGLLYANRGGTQVNMWLPLDAMKNNPVYAQFLDPSWPEWTAHPQRNPDAIRAPSHLYNGTIHPLIRYKIRGAIWYQGESDAEYAGTYSQMMTDLITTWRGLWGYEFPFLSVQLAPYGAVTWDNSEESWAWVREAQMDSLNLPPSGVAVITDCGEYKNIHPQNKKPVGERLALLAAALDDSSIHAQSPVYRSVRFENGKAYIEFEHTAGGLETRRVEMDRNGITPAGEKMFIVPASELCGFEICGEDRRFQKARAEIINGNTVCVQADNIPAPAAVRYGWKNFPLCNLYNSAGLPASSFRTDSYPMPDFKAPAAVPESTFKINSSTPVFAVDFSRDKIDGWEKNKSGISLQSAGKMQGISNAQEKDIVLYNAEKKADAGNFLLRADLEVQRNNAWGGVAFNYRSPKDYYVLRFCTGNDNIQLIRFLNESPRVLERITASEIIQPQTPYTFEIQSVHDGLLNEGLYRIKITNRKTGAVLAEQIKKDSGSGTYGGAAGLYTGTPSDSPLYLYSRMEFLTWR